MYIRLFIKEASPLIRAMNCISYKDKSAACLLERTKSCFSFFSKYWLKHLISTGLHNKDISDNTKKLFIFYVRPSKYSPLINHRSLRLTIMFIFSNLLLLTLLKSYNLEPFIKGNCEIRYRFLIQDHILLSVPCVTHVVDLRNALTPPGTFPRQLTLYIHVDSAFTAAPPCMCTIESSASKRVLGPL